MSADRPGPARPGPRRRAPEPRRRQRGPPRPGYRDAGVWPPLPPLGVAPGVAPCLSGPGLGGELLTEPVPRREAVGDVLGSRGRAGKRRLLSGVPRGEGLREGSPRSAEGCKRAWVDVL